MFYIHVRTDGARASYFLVAGRHLFQFLRWIGKAIGMSEFGFHLLCSKIVGANRFRYRIQIAKIKRLQFMACYSH